MATEVGRTLYPRSLLLLLNLWHLFTPKTFLLSPSLMHTLVPFRHLEVCPESGMLLPPLPWYPWQSYPA